MNPYFISLINILMTVYAEKNTTMPPKEWSTTAGQVKIEKYENVLPKEWNLTAQQVKFDNTTDIFEARLDHFNFSDTRTVRLRYIEYRNRKYESRENEILIIQLDFRREIFDTRIIESHPSWILAKDLGATLILLELRFYGESKPDGFSMYQLEKFRYLNAEQTLEDVIHFIQSYKMRNGISSNGKVGVFGCSYAGNLATWLRYKYPHTIDAAWASSAPLDISLNRKEDYEIIGEMYKRVSSKCYDKIKEVLKLVQHLAGQPNVKALFSRIGERVGKNCTNVEMSGNDLLIYMRRIITNPFNRPEENKKLCEYLTQNTTGNVSRYEDYIRLFSFVTKESYEICNSFDTFRERDMDTFTMRYQMCTEFGHSLSTTTSIAQKSTNDSFSFAAINKENKSCRNKFVGRASGPANIEAILLRNIEKKSLLYGTKNSPVTRVFFIYGTYDPWYSLRRQEKVSSRISPVRNVPYSSHCSDMPTSLVSADEKNEFLIYEKKDGLVNMKYWLMNEQDPVVQYPKS